MKTQLTVICTFLLLTFNAQASVCSSYKYTLKSINFLFSIELNKVESSRYHFGDKLKSVVLFENEDGEVTALVSSKVYGLYMGASYTTDNKGYVTINGYDQQVVTKHQTELDENLESLGKNSACISIDHDRWGGFGNNNEEVLILRGIKIPSSMEDFDIDA